MNVLLSYYLGKIRTGKFKTCQFLLACWDTPMLVKPQLVNLIQLLSNRTDFALASNKKEIMNSTVYMSIYCDSSDTSWVYCTSDPEYRTKHPTYTFIGFIAIQYKDLKHFAKLGSMLPEDKSEFNINAVYRLPADIIELKTVIKVKEEKDFNSKILYKAMLTLKANSISCIINSDGISE